MLGRFELLKDAWGHPIQAIAPDPDGVVSVSIGGTSQRVALLSDTDIVRVASNQPCFFRFGDSGVNAAGTDSLFQAGTEIFRVPEGTTHLAVIQSGTVTGIVTVTRML